MTKRFKVALQKDAEIFLRDVGGGDLSEGIDRCAMLVSLLIEARDAGEEGVTIPLLDEAVKPAIM